MPIKPEQAREQFANMPFPTAGIDISRGFTQQRSNTTPLGINVRAFDPITNRMRGGCRSGLSRYLPVRPNGINIIQELATLVGVGYTPPGGGMQTSSSGRVVSLVAVSGGNVYVASPGGSAWVAATNGTMFTPPLSSSGVITSAPNNQQLWFADGTHWAYYDPSDNTVHPWAATAGSLPIGDDAGTPRLITTWRGRTVLAGLVKDSQNWFMSKVSDPTDFDYFPTSPGPAQAVAGNNSPLGLIGDVITAMIAYTDDVLIMGGDHTIFQFSGDPADGGRIDLISDAIGMAWGSPWCKAPDGTLYFVSNKTGIYQLQPGQGPPQRISQAIEQLLIPIDTGANTIRMIWDDRFQGMHVFITPTAGQADTTHFFWEQRSNAWWEDHFTNTAHNPLCVTTFDGNDPGDRRPLIGSWDGYVRSIDPAALDDDGVAIASSVILGPMQADQMGDLLCRYLQCTLGEDSGSITYQVYVGTSAEKALSSSPVASGTWHNGRNLNTLVQRAGHAVYVKISGLNPWAMEWIRADVESKGRVRIRGA